MLAPQALLAGDAGIAAVLLDLGEPRSEIVSRAGKHPRLVARAHEVVEASAHHDAVLRRTEIPLIGAVDDEQAVVGIEQSEAVGYPLDREVEALPRAFECLGEALLIGDVAGGADHADRAAFRVAQREAVLARPAPLPVARAIAHLALETLGLALEMIDERLVEAREVFGMDATAPVHGRRAEFRPAQP